ncbi:alpha/beta fold hydrolase [Actinoallomurus rhizosphaericola]|nr:hypothetical protein [Actinoallomurus rhizosphaericola]MCO5998971.1 hypothetical protein [Actinoallomurus rhizosphaericola]
MVRDADPELAAVLPGARTVELPGQGHYCHATSPALIGTHLRDFFDGAG